MPNCERRSTRVDVFNIRFLLHHWLIEEGSRTIRVGGQINWNIIILTSHTTTALVILLAFLAHDIRGARANRRRHSHHAVVSNTSVEVYGVLVLLLFFTRMDTVVLLFYLVLNLHLLHASIACTLRAMYSAVQQRHSKRSRALSLGVQCTGLILFTIARVEVEAVRPENEIFIVISTNIIIILISRDIN